MNNSRSGKSVNALDYYRMYAGTAELPKYFCGAYDLSLPPGAQNVPEIIVDECCDPTTSPTSSITSTRKLEWDSGADIGYANCDPKRFISKSTSMPILQPHDVCQMMTSAEPQFHDQEQSSKHRELMAFLRTKVGRPRAESTPLISARELQKADSDPEIYTFQTPKMKTHLDGKRFNTITFHYQVPSPRTDDKLTPLITEAGEDKENTTLPQKTLYFTCYQRKKLSNLRISKPVSIECTNNLQPAETHVSVAIQTSASSSTAEIVDFHHPRKDSDAKTTSTTRSTRSDQVFSQCNSFEYVSGLENEAATKKTMSSSYTTTESTESSRECSESARKQLQLMQRVINSKKYSSKEKEVFVKKLAKKMLTERSGTLVESEKNVKKDNSDGSATKTEEDKKSVDWKSVENETNSERIYSSLESSDAPREALITYAKMERESQLNWISNEIEHLGKLRTLLESRKTKRQLHMKTTLPSGLKKSTAVYMITTQRSNPPAGDCNQQCAPRVTKTADGVIDFHIHNTLGSRDYQFKEIITKITPSNPCPPPNPDHPRSCVSEPCPNGPPSPSSQPPPRTCCTCHHCCACGEGCPQQQQSAGNRRRDIFPQETEEVPSPRRRSASPKSTSEGRPSTSTGIRHLNPIRPQTAPSLRNKGKSKSKPQSRKLNGTSDNDESGAEMRWTGAGYGAPNKAGASDDSSSDYSSISKSSKSSKHEERCPVKANTSNNEGSQGSLGKHKKTSKDKKPHSTRRPERGSPHYVPNVSAGEGTSRAPQAQPQPETPTTRYVECPAPTYSSKGMCACPKASRKKCQCTISATEDVCLQTTISNLVDIGVRTDETLIAVDSKEVQVDGGRPVMVAVGTEMPRRPLTIQPAKVTSNIPNVKDEAIDATRININNLVTIRDLSVNELSNAVVISSEVTPSANNPQDRIRRIIIEVPMPAETIRRTTRADSGVGVESVTSNSDIAILPTPNEMVCSCCGKVITDNDILVASDFLTPTTGQAKTPKPTTAGQQYACAPNNTASNDILPRAGGVGQFQEMVEATANGINMRVICKNCHQVFNLQAIEVKRPIAYVLKFTDSSSPNIAQLPHISPNGEELINNPAMREKRKKNNASRNVGNMPNRYNRRQEQEMRSGVQDYLHRNRPDFVRSAEERRRYLIELAYTRGNRSSDRYEKLMSHNNDEIPAQNPEYNDEMRRVRLFSTKEMKRMTAKIYQNLPEVQQQRHAYKTDQIKRFNRLLVGIFNKKLKESVLRGQPSLSTSISVINLS